jgi:hypothetical protein
MRKMRDSALEDDFPLLASGDYCVTSDKDVRYNCIAWAVGDISNFWYDLEIRGYYWPPGVPSADTLDGWIGVFRLHGYAEAESAELEPDYEKVAIYAGPEGPEHVARQKASGAWTSKMGKGHDIEHPLNALEGDLMGTVVRIMKRKCKNALDKRSEPPSDPLPECPSGLSRAYHAVSCQLYYCPS